MRPIHRAGTQAGCLVLACTALLSSAAAQTQYDARNGYPTRQAVNQPRQAPTHPAEDSAWTGQQTGYQQPTPSPAQHVQGTQRGDSARNTGHPQRPNAVVAASAQEPAADTRIPAGIPTSTEPRSTNLTPIKGVDRGTTESEASGGVMQTIVSVGSSLLIVAGLFFGLVWVYRKTARSTGGGSLPKQVVNVLGRAPIAARQQMVLVRFGNKLVLVSLVQGDARPISEITDPLEVDRLSGLCESAKPDSSVQSFRSFLSEGSKQ